MRTPVSDLMLGYTGSDSAVFLAGGAYVALMALIVFLGLRDKRRRP